VLLADLQATGALPAEWETAHPQARSRLRPAPPHRERTRRLALWRQRGTAPEAARVSLLACDAGRAPGALADAAEPRGAPERD